MNLKKQEQEAIMNLKKREAIMNLEKQEEIKKLTEKYSPEEIRDSEKKINDFLGAISVNVYRDYLPFISEAYTVKEYQTNIATDEAVAYIELKKFVVDEEEEIIDCLKMVYHVMAYSSNTIALIIRRQQRECTIGLAVGCNGGREITIKNMGQLRDALVGSFPGTDVKDYVLGDSNNTGIKSFVENESSLLSDVLNDTYAKSVAIVSNVATDLGEDFSVQGIEKLLDGISPIDDTLGYTLILLGESVDNNNLSQKKDAIFNAYSSLSPYAEMQSNWSIGEAKEWSDNWNASVGVHGGINIPGLAKVGIDVHSGYGHTWGGSINANKGGSIEITNYKVKHTLELLERQIKRLEESEALGLWNFAAYVLSPALEITSEVAHMYMSLTQGKESYCERSAINIWDVFKQKEDEKEFNQKQISAILGNLKYLSHPQFSLIPDSNFAKSVICPKETTATTTLSGIEMARALNLPGKSVPGFAVIKCAAFGREISSYDKLEDADINIGKIHHMHHDENKAVDLSRKSLASHVFITGSTGSGKSNTVYNLLAELAGKENHKVSFLVVEPTKGEYGYAFGKGVSVYGTRPNSGKMLQLNPFVFSRGIHVFEHIDRILEVFNICWPMYAAMPAVLKDAVIKAYEKTGWNLRTSKNNKGNIYPTFEDVLTQIDVVMDDSKYSDENKGNYKGALSTRIQSLTNGLNGLVFCEGNINDEALFDENVIVDLSKIGSNETKSLIMGVLVIRLQEYRMSQGGINQDLKHVTVLEEAHNILKNATVQGSGEVGNIAAKSVEMISNAIAEMRTYGEGFIVVDQAPGLMDMSVIRNTNTKIIMRLPDKSDRELVGKAAGLNDVQIEELAKLQKGVAAVYQNEWIEPVLCKVNYYDSKITSINEKTNDSDTLNALNKLAEYVYCPENMEKCSETEFVDAVEKVRLQGELKALLIDYYRTPFPRRQEIWQKVVKHFFKKEIEKAIDVFSDSVPKDNSIRNLILDEIRNRYGLYSIQDENVDYRFVQAFLCESIETINENLTVDSGSIVNNIEQCMSDLKEMRYSGKW